MSTRDTKIEKITDLAQLTPQETQIYCATLHKKVQKISALETELKALSKRAADNGLARTQYFIDQALTALKSLD